MASSITSYSNLLAFLLTTLFYYLALKPSLKLEDLSVPNLYDSYVGLSYKYLAIYFLIIILIQIIINVGTISSMCGGAITQNIGYSSLITLLPWTFIFGVLIVVLAIYPGFRKIFGDVIGYFFISSSANKILVELLINKDIQKNIDKDTTIPQEERARMQDAADMIIKICGNTSILINQFTPTNFLEYWNLMKPLMKSKYDNGTSADALDMQQQLFELVLTKDNIGEATWYIYTGILLVSFVQLKISSRGCINNSATQQANYASFLANEKEVSDKKQQTQSTVYTISS